MDNQTPPNQINIELKEDVAHGEYCNLVVVTHSDQEFVLDFVSVIPGMPKAQVRSRIILTPTNAKRLLQSLGVNISKFEDANGKIKTNGSGPSGQMPPIGFKNAGEA